jgi:hypothetical protein
MPRLERPPLPLDEPINMGKNRKMKTTLEIPDSLFRRVKSESAKRGQSLGAFINLALETTLREGKIHSSDKPWMKQAGAFRRNRKESHAMAASIREAFETVNEQEWA